MKTLEEIISDIQDEYDVSPEAQKRWDEHYNIYPYDNFYINSHSLNFKIDMETVAKFSVQNIQPGEYPTSEGTKKVKTITMGAVYNSDPESENGKFFASTPSVSCSLGIVNEAAADVFGQPGDEILVTFRNLSAEKRAEAPDEEESK